MNTILQHASNEPAATPARTVKVWDPLVRLFHWSMAAFILGAFLVEEGDTAHRWLGYAAIGLIGFRVLWGLVGSRHARFGDWVRGPRSVATYLRQRLATQTRAQPGGGGDDPALDGLGQRGRRHRLDADAGCLLGR